MSSLTYPDNEVVSYTYRPQGGIKTVASTAQTYLSDATYNAAGQLTRLVYGNNVTTDYTYDPQTLRLADLRTQTAGGLQLQDYSYQFDPVGNVRTLTDRVGQASQSFQYDALNRLTSAVGSYGSYTYAYNALGNMTSKEGVSLSYPAAGSPRPHAVTATSDGKAFTYDASGNRLSQVASGVTTTYQYDAEGRLSKVTPPSGGATSYLYDGDGGRAQQTVGAGARTHWVGELYEVPPGTTKTKYIFAGSLRLAAVDKAGTSRTTRFYHTDHLGSSNVLTDATGHVVERAEYTPYGSVINRTGAFTAPQKFTGQRLDATGLYFYQARYYDAATGRFISADPTVQSPDDPQDLNRYAYCRNNPVNLVDPTGYGFWKKFFGIVAIVAAVVVRLQEDKLVFQVGAST